MTMTITRPTVRLIFAGGGTGGHLYPAIAIADKIREIAAQKMNVEIRFVGTKRGIEYRMRDRLGYPLELINIRGLARSLDIRNLLLPFVVLGALIKSWQLLSRFKPDVVVGTGGYVCWPILKTASWRNVPTVLQEQNSFPGIATRQNAPSAKRIYLGFEGARSYFKTDGEVILTGNPVRANIANGNRENALNEFGLDPARKTILVLGGSQGARAINKAVLQSIENKSMPANYQLLWQTGKGDHKDVIARAGNKISTKAMFPFAHDMSTVYAAADLVIARAGALTLAELSACDLPAILIPYPYAAGDHQKKNAQELVEAGTASMIEETELAEVDILSSAISLMESEKFDAIKSAMTTVEHQRPAVDMIAEDILNLITQTRKGDGLFDADHVDTAEE